MSEQSKSISEKIKELNELVAWFDGEDFELEKALDKYSSAAKLASEIEEDLVNFKNEVNVLTQKFD